MNYNYTAYDLRISSEIELPELEICKRDLKADLSICLALVPEFIDPINKADYCQSNGESILINFPGILRALVDTKGTRIQLQALDSNALSVRCILFSSVFAAVLYTRKFFLMHAAGQIFKNKVYAFAGQSGAGKSTLCASLTSRGYLSLSDDLLALSSETSYQKVSPGVPRLRLNTNSLQQLNQDPKDFIQMPLQPEKSGRVGAKQCVTNSLVLLHLVILEKASVDKLVLEQVTGIEKVLLLHQHGFRNEIAELIFSKREYMAICSSIASQIRVSRIRRPAASDSINDLTDLIEQEFFQ